MMNENEIFDVPSGLTAEFHTLGCKLNYAETSQIAAMLSDRGIERVTRGGAGSHYCKYLQRYS